jgi:hypothetical protein
LFGTKGTTTAGNGKTADGTAPSYFYGNGIGIICFNG